MDRNYQRIMSKQNLYLQSINEFPSKKNPFLAIISPKEVKVKNMNRYKQNFLQNQPFQIGKSEIKISKDHFIRKEFQVCHEHRNQKFHTKPNFKQTDPWGKNDLNIQNLNMNSPKSTKKYFRNSEIIEENVQYEEKSVLTEINLNKSIQFRLISQRHQKNPTDYESIGYNQYKINYLEKDSRVSENTDGLSSAITCQNLNSNSYLNEEKKVEKVRQIKEFTSKLNLKRF